VRRLIVLAMQGMVVKPIAPRAMPSGSLIIKKTPTTMRCMAFQLFDALKRFEGMPPIEQEKALPHLATVKTASALLKYPTSLSPEDAFMLRIGVIEKKKRIISAHHFCRRVEAVKYALENITRQAQRMLRLLAKRKGKSPMRLGRAPGYSPNKNTEINEILHDLQYHALVAFNTS